MTFGSFLILLLIAALCGALGQALAGYSLGGCFASIAVGFVGAFLGMLLANELDFPTFWVIEVGGKDFPIVWSIIGSALLALIFGMINRARVRTYD